MRKLLALVFALWKTDRPFDPNHHPWENDKRQTDAEKMPAYLESSKERNVPLYERNGFKVIEVLSIAKDGPMAWRMWRDPQ